MSRVRQTAYLSGARLLGMAVSFFSTPFFITWLGGKEAGLASWGAFVFVQAMGRYAAMIDSGFAIAANRLMTRAHAVGDSGELWRTWHVGLRACVSVGLIGAVITLAMGFLMPVSGLKPGELPIQLFAGAAIGFLAETVANAVRTALTSRQQFSNLAAIQGIAQLVGALLALVAVYWARHPAALFVGPVSVSAIQLFLALGAVRREAWPAPDGDRRSIMPNLWAFVLRAYPNHMLSIVAGSTDRVLLEKSLGAEPLGGYALASRIPEVLTFLLQPIWDTSQPILSRAHVEGEERFAQETLRITKMALAIGIAFILVPCAFADPLLKLWLRDNYVASLAPILVGIAAFRAIEHFNGTVLLAFNAAGNPGLANPASLFHAASIAAFTYPVALYFGLEGVVWLKLAIQVQALLMIWILFRKLLPSRSMGPTLRTMGLTVAVGTLMAAFGWELFRLGPIASKPWLAVPLAPVFSLATFVALAKLGLTPVPGPLARLLPFLRNGEI